MKKKVKCTERTSSLKTKFNNFIAFLSSLLPFYAPRFQYSTIYTFAIHLLNIRLSFWFVLTAVDFGCFETGTMNKAVFEM